MAKPPFTVDRRLRSAVRKTSWRRSKRIDFNATRTTVIQVEDSMCFTVSGENWVPRKLENLEEKCDFEKLCIEEERVFVFFGGLFRCCLFFLWMTYYIIHDCIHIFFGYYYCLTSEPCKKFWIPFSTIPGFHEMEHGTNLGNWIWRSSAGCYSCSCQGASKSLSGGWPGCPQALKHAPFQIQYFKKKSVSGRKWPPCFFPWGGGNCRKWRIGRGPRSPCFQEIYSLAISTWLNWLEARRPEVC